MCLILRILINYEYNLEPVKNEASDVAGFCERNLYFYRESYCIFAVWVSRTQRSSVYWISITYGDSKIGLSISLRIGYSISCRRTKGNRIFKIKATTSYTFCFNHFYVDFQTLARHTRIAFRSRNSVFRNTKQNENTDETRWERNSSRKPMKSHPQEKSYRWWAGSISFR